MLEHPAKIITTSMIAKFFIIFSISDCAMQVTLYARDYLYHYSSSNFVTLVRHSAAQHNLMRLKKGEMRLRQASETQPDGMVSQGRNLQ
jgi:hypothetical protein